MKFEYEAYGNMVRTLLDHGYHIANYHDYSEYEKCAILRHDIDTSLEKAVELAEYETSISDEIHSTYFVLITSDLYNINSYENIIRLKQIEKLGCEIGLHFDEMRYPDLFGDMNSIIPKILSEKKILESIIESPVSVVSMHRPSKAILESNIEIPDMINSYSSEFFHSFKYLSDSRRNWREPALDIIKSETFNRIHLLTHAFWYNIKEKDLHDSIESFINQGNYFRYSIMKQNITRLEEIMDESEIR